MNNKYESLSAALKGKHLPEQNVEPTVEEKKEQIEAIAAPKKRSRPQGKRSNPDYFQVGVYIPKKLHTRVKKILLERENTDFSELVSSLLQQWVESQNPNSKPD